MRTYNELALEGRVEMQQRFKSVDGLRAIERLLGRAVSAISHECLRASAHAVSYKPQVVQWRSRQCRTKPRVTRKLGDPTPWETVRALLWAR